MVPPTNCRCEFTDVVRQVSLPLVASDVLKRRQRLLRLRRQGDGRPPRAYADAMTVRVWLNNGSVEDIAARSRTVNLTRYFSSQYVEYRGVCNGITYQVTSDDWLVLTESYSVQWYSDDRYAWEGNTNKQYSEEVTRFRPGTWTRVQVV